MRMIPAWMVYTGFWIMKILLEFIIHSLRISHIDFSKAALTNSKDANIFGDKRYEFWRWDTLNVLFWKWWYRVPIFQWIFIDKINNNRATPTRIFENLKWNKLMLARYLKLKTIICYPFFLLFSSFSQSNVYKPYWYVNLM